MGDQPAMSTADLLTAINGNDELPFGAWNDGKGLNHHSFLKLLKPYGVKSKTVRVDDQHTAKGYAREDLSDGWARYLPSRSHGSHESQHTQHTDNPHGSGVTAVTEVTQMAQEEGHAQGSL